MVKNEFDESCRSQIYDGSRFLITEVGTSEEDKIRLGVNCDGYGRIRRFMRNKDSDWIDNPLPFDPFSNSMGLERVNDLNVQVFQVAKCNLNCWWCFIPDEYKTCSMEHTRWYSADDLIELYIRDAKDISNVIDISGGNPELVPEFVLGMMQGLERAGVSDKVYLWSDDVLTTDYLFTKLNKKQIEYMTEYRHYGKVACFKGIDSESFSYNTCNSIGGFENQLSMAKRYIDAGFDIYFYIVLTMLDTNRIDERISALFDQLQKIAYYLPLRIVPIKIKKFATNEHRFSVERNQAIENQYMVLEEWRNELSKRYTAKELNTNISLLQLK